MKISLVTLTGETLSLVVESCETIASVKAKVEKDEGIPSENQRLVFCGTKMEDCRTLVDCNVLEGSTLGLDLRLRGGGQIRRSSLSCTSNTTKVNHLIFSKQGFNFCTS